MIIKKTIDHLLTAFTLVCTLLVYYLILNRLGIGTSCDEGFYLQGYLSNQTANYGVSDFHNIVKSFLPILPADFALSLRYVRFFATLIALSLFALTSYLFFTKRRKVKLNKITYISLVFLSGAIGFCFASPVLYYDSIQTIIYLLVFSAFFDILSRESYRFLSLFLIGFLLVFALTNYLPSGILLGFSILFLTYLYKKLTLKKVLFGLFGFLFGVLFYHFLINNILEWGNRVFIALTTHQTYHSAGYGHSSSGLLLNVFEYLIDFAKYLIIPAILSFIYFFVNSKIRNKHTRYFISFVFISILLTFCVFAVKNAYSTILFIPIAFLIVNHICTVKIIFNKKSLKQFLIGIIFAFLPAMAVFGTNQKIAVKAEFFVFLWIILLVNNNLIRDSFQRKFITLLFTCCLVIAYVFLGHFSRFQYYYTPKQSVATLENTVNFNNIKIAKNQKQFIEKTITLMRENGFKQGDKVIAFGENQIISYAVGGVVPNLVYEFSNMLNSPEYIPEDKTHYIIINQGEEERFTAFVNKHRNWNFPHGYKRYEVGHYAENMPLPYFKTVLFCLEQ